MVNDDEFDLDPSGYFVGLVPKCNTHREKCWDSFVSFAKQRFGLVTDTGAPSSCVGSVFIDRFIDTFSLASYVHRQEHKAQLSGIGQGAAQVNWVMQVPVGIESIGEAFWKTQRLEGIGQGVPPLLGLDTMMERDAIIDLRKRKGQKHFIMHLRADDDKTHELKVFRVNGHLILPIDWGGTTLPDKTTFLTDPLGLHVFLTETETEQPTTTGTETTGQDYVG